MTSDPRRSPAVIILGVASVIAWTTVGAASDSWPPGFPAAVYDLPHPAASRGIAAKALAEALPDVEWSGCLALAAEVVLTENGNGRDPRLPDGRLHAITRAAGCTDPLPTLLVVDTSETSTVDIVAELRRVRPGADGAATRAGISRNAIDRGRYRWRWVAILSARSAELAAVFPRVLDLGAVVPLRVRLLQDELDAPTAVIARPDGEVRRHTLESAGQEWWTLVPAGTAEGPLTVQLLAESETGPRLVAVLDLWVGADPPDPALDDHVTSTEPHTFDTVEAARQWMLTRINELRRAAGVQELESDAVLDQLASAHCEDMRRGDFVGHRSPVTGELPDRLRAADVDYRAARENVAWAGGVESAMRQLERSPAHRTNLLAPDIDRVGIGLVATPDVGDPARQWLVTQVLVGSTPGFSVDQVLAAASAGVESPVRCPELDVAAGALADEPYAVALDADTSFIRLRDALGARPDRWGSLKLAVVRVNGPREVRLPDILDWDRAEAWGVAVRRLPWGDLPPFQIVWVASTEVPWRDCD